MNILHDFDENCQKSFCFPLAGRRFRLAGYVVETCRWRVSTARYCGGCRKCVLFPVGEGGQTEWCNCWSGRLSVSCVGFAAREWVRARGSDGSPRNVLMVSDGRALGMEVEMDGGLHPPAPLKGGDGGETDKCRGRCLPDIATDSPTARRLVMVMGYGLLVIEKGVRDGGG